MNDQAPNLNENLHFITVVPPVRSIIHIGNLEIHNSKQWCWLHRKMMALCFGWHVENKTTTDHDNTSNTDET